MTKQKINPILIIALIVVAVILLPKLGLFSVTGLEEGYISNEPETIQELIDSGFAEEYNYTVFSDNETMAWFLQEEGAEEGALLFWELELATTTCEEAIGQVGDIKEKQKEIYGRDIYLTKKEEWEVCLEWDMDWLQEKQESCSVERSNLENHFGFNQNIINKLHEDCYCGAFCSGSPAYLMEEEYGDSFYCNITFLEEERTYSYTIEDGIQICSSSYGDSYCEKLPQVCIDLIYHPTSYPLLGVPCLEKETIVEAEYAACNNKNNLLIMSIDMNPIQNYMDYFTKEGSWYNQEILKGVELWMLLVAIGGIFLIIIMGRK